MERWAENVELGTDQYRGAQQAQQPEPQLDRSEQGQRELGVLALLGSSAVAINVISGMVLIYARSFQEGDLIRINELTGRGQPSSLLVNRMQGSGNELLNISQSRHACLADVSLSRREIHKQVALSAEITIGYEVPWREVHTLMMDKAGCRDPLAALSRPPQKN